MDRIDFNHFFLETKGLIDQKYSVALNPHSQLFFKSKDVYFALTVYGDTVYVNMMQGSKNSNYSEGLREFVKETSVNFNFLKFGTFEGNRIISFYKYLGAVYQKTIEKYYSDGSNYVEYVLDLKNCKRMKKV